MPVQVIRIFAKKKFKNFVLSYRGIYFCILRNVFLAFCLECNKATGPPELRLIEDNIICSIEYIIIEYGIQYMQYLQFLFVLSVPRQLGHQS